MLKIVMLGMAIAVPVIMSAPPAMAYDPCERATNAYRQAVAERDAYCEANRVNRYFCRTPGTRGQRLYQRVVNAREAMADACR